ncbi:glucoamylase family protein [Solimonas terrae]|uniref:Beta-glucosidase n=1 Tax=Solimonas terrae TaxID=1396819 RepID=A0A6M2BR12_9GAMM|nr:glucoamylase family protein [Solimonas terrae]NGY04665.1 beta-glucosidase [Solimonas terrae]
MTPAALAKLDDEALIDAVQRQTFRFFWDGAHPRSGLAPDRRTTRDEPVDDLVAIGGSGFGVMALIVAAERGWQPRDAVVARLNSMLDVLCRATCYHGAYPHFMNGETGATIPFGRKDDGGDLVETALLFQGLLCARQYFDRDTPAEASIRDRITWLWRDVEWDWYTRGGRKLLYWHWSPNNGWALDHEIHGWNECLITYVLAAGSPTCAIDPLVYHRGYAAGRDFLNGKSYHGIELPLGMPYGGPLFFAHYSFCGLDPHGLKDRYADYWELNCRHVRINRAHCIANPGGYKGYGEACWGLTASDDYAGYSAHAPDNDNGTISPTAALASLPYAPAEVMSVLRHFLTAHGERIWGRYGFVDAFCEQRDWAADTFLAIDQGPIIVMMENHRSGLLWKLFMSVPEVQDGLRRLGFSSPHLDIKAGH